MIRVKTQARVYANRKGERRYQVLVPEETALKVAVRDERAVDELLLVIAEAVQAEEAEANQ